LLVRLFFFFQAEDGIRDWSVTGVQTCALPIYQRRTPPSEASSAAVRWAGPQTGEADARDAISRRRGRHALRSAPRLPLGPCAIRSEERRVGKRGDSGGRRIREKKKRVDQSGGQ